MVTGLVSMGAVALSAAPANANENFVKGTAECVQGRYVVDWTVTNSDKKLDEKLTVAVWPEDSKLELDDEIEAGKSISGKQILAKGSRGIKDAKGRDVAKIHVHGEWKSGDKVLEHDEFVDVPLPGECGDKPKPTQKPDEDQASAAIVLSCEAFSIELTNPTDRPVRFKVFIRLDDNQPLTEEFKVDAGDTLTLPEDLDKDDAGSVAKISEDGELEFSKIKVAVAVRDKKLAEKSLDVRKCEDEDNNAEETTSPAPSPSVSSSQVASGGDDNSTTEPSPAAESDSLPVTGASLGGLIAAAALVLGLGVGLVVMTRRKKRV